MRLSRYQQVQAAAKAALHIENAKRVRNGQHAVTFVKVLSGQAKRFHGTKFKLVLQARSVAGIQTFDVDVWHRVQRTALGDITSNKFEMSKFEDSDASFITRFEKSGEESGFHGRLSMFGDMDSGADGADMRQAARRRRSRNAEAIEVLRDLEVDSATCLLDGIRPIFVGPVHWTHSRRSSEPCSPWA